ncbi:hypothetical protein SUDANB25_00801 [Streptomyces sp. SudanB25_2051]
MINHAFHDLVGLVLAIELLALVTASEGDPAEAAVLQGAAGALWESVGPPLFGSAYFSAPRKLCERRAREALGAERFGAYVAEGARLSMDAAVARALAGGERRTGGAGRGAEGSQGLEEPEGPDGPGVCEGAEGSAERAGPVPGTRKPAGSPTGKGGETAG